MKSLTLFALRLSTGLLMVIWGLIKAQSPESAIHVSDTYYAGTLSAEALQVPLGLAQVAVGALVILGVLRRFVYPVQAVWLVLGAVSIWQYLLTRSASIWSPNRAPCSSHPSLSLSRHSFFFCIRRTTHSHWTNCSEDELHLRRGPASSPGGLDTNCGLGLPIYYRRRPTRLISQSSSTPLVSFTRARTVSPRVSMSSAVASPVLMRKLQCCSLTCAPPTLRPRHPAASMSCQLFWPGGF